MLKESGVAISLMKEALTLLDAPELVRAAYLLQMAIEAVRGSDVNEASSGAIDGDAADGRE